MNPVSGLAIESRSLEQLKLDASRDPKSAVRKAATQFEAMFMQMILKSMRDATPQGGLMGDSSQQMYTGMLDSQLAQKMAGKGVGLADMLTKQLSRQMNFDKSDGAQGAPTTGSGKTISGLVRPAPEISLDRLRSQLQQAMAPGMAREALSRESIYAKGASVAGAAGQSEMTDRLKAAMGSSLSPPQREFVQRLWDPAVAAEKSTGVPALFIIGQAALETGWGKHEIKDGSGGNSFNLFGIKAGASWKGATVSATTTEYTGQGKVKVVEKFRSYGSYTEAFQDWAKLMSNSPRYGQVLKTGGSINEFANGLQRAGYATDPAYASKLTRTIEQTLKIRRLVT